jgi:hypothetical protein
MWKAMRLGGLCTLVIAGVLSLSNVAEAARVPARYPQPITCTGGTSAAPNVIAGGTYASITVKGVCYVAADTTITVGNVYVVPGATLDAQSASTINVGRNITAFPGSTLLLGCETDATDSNLSHPCDYGTGNSAITVNGNVIALGATLVSLDGDSVTGDVFLIGGGEHTPDCTNPDCAVNNWPIKLNTIGGNLTVQGVSPDWIGVIYNNIGGNVILNNITVDTGIPAGLVPPAENIDVGHNMIGRNLICHGLLPDVVGGFGAPGAAANTFTTGRGYGQCADLTLEAL